MAKKNETKVGIKVTDNGTLKETGNKAKNAGKQVKGLTDSSTSADRAMKGLSKQSSNSTKNFSKMSQGLSGGLVPAYATLAANIFALGAAYRFLQSAADHKILMEGQKIYAAVSGVAYKTLTRTIIEATDAQITYADAAQAAAIGTAAGLSANQLERLGNAAKLASIALGRDVTDAFNRLVRGTTKAEPELLDELGIILRLDTALESYATLLGKSKNELSQFEKSQAITNDVLAQAESKFGAIAALMDPEVNKLNQMAKKFDDLTNAFKLFIAGPAGAIAEFFGNNIMAAAGALALLATPLLTMLIPSFEEFEKKSVRAISRHNEALVVAQKNAKDFANATTASQLKATASYNKSAGKLGTLSQSVAPGKAGTGLANLQAGKNISSRQLGALRSQANRELGIFKTMHPKIRQSWIKVMNQMALDHKKKTAKVKVGTEKIVFNYKVTGAKMRIAWEKAMLGMKAAQSSLVSAANKALGALGWISIGFLIFDLAKQGVKMLGWFGDSADVASTAIGKLRDNQKDLNSEIEEMLRARELMMAGDDAPFSALIQQGGKMLVSAAIGDTLKVVQATEKHAQKVIAEERAKGLGGGQTVDSQGNKMTKRDRDGGIVPLFNDVSTEFMKAQAMATEAQKAREDLAVRIDKIAESKGFSILTGLGDKIRGGMDMKNMDKDMSSFIETIIEGSQATDRIQQNADKYSKSVQDNLVGEATKDLKFQFTLEQKLTDLQAQRKAAALKDQSDPAFIAMLDTKIVKQQEMVDVHRTFVDSLEEQRLAELRLKMRVSQFKSNPFAKTQAGKRSQIRDKISGKDLEMAKINLEIEKRVRLRREGMDGDKLETFLQKNAALRRSVLLLGQQKDELKATIDPLTQLEQAASMALESGMQSAIMGVIDGTKSMKEGFLDMAKAVLVAIAQIIAKLIAMKAIESAAMMFGIPLAEGGVIPMAKGGIKPKGYRKGGVATEPTYLVGEGKHNEAVVPLPDGRSIPVVMTGGGGNTTVNVNIASDGQTTESMTSDNGDQGAKLGRAISAAVQEEMHKQQRPGGILSPYGG